MMKIFTEVKIHGCFLNAYTQIWSNFCLVGAFVKRIVDKSNCLEFLSLKKVMNQYMSALLEAPQGGAVSVDIEFVTNNDAFEKAVTENFGHFKLRDESVVRNQQQQQQMQQLRQAERQASRANLAVRIVNIYCSLEA